MPALRSKVKKAAREQKAFSKATKVASALVGD